MRTITANELMQGDVIKPEMIQQTVLGVGEVDDMIVVLSDCCGHLTDYKMAPGEHVALIELSPHRSEA